MTRVKGVSRAPWANSAFRLESRQVVRAVELLLTAIIVVASIVPLARFLGVALQRVSYPYPVEWCEGAIVVQIHRVLAGQQLYVEPSLEFTSYIYPPLYYVVSALPTLVFGTGHFAPRLVSLLSILGCFVLLGRWVRDETDDPVAGLAAVGLLSATYQLTGFWFELARVDAFFLLLVLSSHLTARTVKTPARAVLLGVLIAGAALTKQLGIPLAVPALLLVAMRSLRLGLIAAGVSGTIVLFTALTLNITSHGWFFYYVLDLPSRHAVQISRLWPSLQQFFLGATFPMTLAGLAILCGMTFARRFWRGWLFHAVFIGLAFTTAFLPFLKTGGYPNGLIPAYAALALASGLALGALRRGGTGSALGSIGPRLIAAVLLVVQVVALDYDPTPALPTATDLSANKEVIARLRALPKPLFVTGSSYYNLVAGSEDALTDTMGLTDIYNGRGPEMEHLDVVLTEAIRHHRFKTIVMDRVYGFLPNNIVSLIRQEYLPQGSVLHGLPPDVIWPKSGAWVRPDTVWVAR